MREPAKHVVLTSNTTAATPSEFEFVACMANRAQIARTDQIYWAKCTNGPVSARSGTSASNMTCYDCGDILIYVKRHTRCIGETSYDVKAHYRHAASSLTHSCRPETVEHNAAKHALVRHGPKWSFRSKCTKCAEFSHVSFGDTQYRWKDEVPVSWGGRDYRIDVAILDIDNAVTGAVEVKVTHAVDEEKALAMSREIAWAEVTADDVLECVRRDEYTLDATQGSESVCSTCRQKGREYILSRIVKQCDEYPCFVPNGEDWKSCTGRILHAIRDVAQRTPSTTASSKFHATETTDSTWREMQNDVRYVVFDHEAKVSRRTTHWNETETVIVDTHIDRIFRGDIVLTFGKHVGRRLSDLSDSFDEDEWGYVAWLAGAKKPMKSQYGGGYYMPRDSGDAGHCRQWITPVIHKAAKRMVRRTCLNCRKPRQRKNWLCSRCMCRHGRTCSRS